MEQGNPHDTQQLPPVNEGREFGEVIGQWVDEAKMAWHGLRANIASGRAERADERLEALEHKEVLYGHLGATALGRASHATEADGSTPRPETAAERYMDQRMDRRAFKRAVRKSQRQRAVKVFGGEESNTLGSRARAETRARTKDAAQDYKDGYLTAGELRQAKNMIKGSPSGAANPEQRRTSRQLRIAEVGTQMAVDQPVASRWRRFRQGRAEQTYSESVRRASEHRRKQREIASKRAR